MKFQMFHFNRIKYLILVLLFLSFIPDAKAIVEPTSDFYINDYANILSNETEEYVLNKSMDLNKVDGTQIVVVTVENLEDMTIEDYANKLFRDFGIGDSEKNNGLLLLLALEEREFRVEVGYGLEGILPDGKTGRFQDEYIIPYLKNDNWDDGIKNGYDAFYKEIVTLNNLNIDYSEPLKSNTISDKIEFIFNWLKNNKLSLNVNKWVNNNLEFLNAFFIFFGIFVGNCFCRDPKFDKKYPKKVSNVYLSIWFIILLFFSFALNSIVEIFICDLLLFILFRYFKNKKSEKIVGFCLCVWFVLFLLSNFCLRDFSEITIDDMSVVGVMISFPISSFVSFIVSLLFMTAFMTDYSDASSSSETSSSGSYSSGSFSSSSRSRGGGGSSGGGGSTRRF